MTEFNKYIPIEYQTSEWKIRRKEILKRDQYACKKCGNQNMRSLQIHHIYYEYGYDMHDYPDLALITLCSEHHKDWHRKFKTQTFNFRTKESEKQYHIDKFFNWLKEGVNSYTNKEISKLRHQQRKQKKRKKSFEKLERVKRLIEVEKNSRANIYCTKEEYLKLLSKTYLGLVFIVSFGEYKDKICIVKKDRQHRFEKLLDKVDGVVVSDAGEVIRDYFQIFDLKFLRFVVDAEELLRLMQNPNYTNKQKPDDPDIDKKVKQFLSAIKNFDKERK